MKEDTMQLTLTPQEQEVLSGAIKSAISDLGTEVGHTDNQAMRQDLQQSKKVLSAILDRSTSLPEGLSFRHESVPDFRMPRRLRDEPRPVPSLLGHDRSGRKATV